MNDLREIERESIREFVYSAREEFAGRSVMDVGAGQQPYRDIVEEAGGEYVPYDAPSFPASCTRYDTTGQAFGRRFGAFLCTQVAQYVEDPRGFFEYLRVNYAAPGAVMVMTYPTNWPEVEWEDLHRFTKSGMGRILVQAGWAVERHETRAFVQWMTADAPTVALGYGVVARVPSRVGMAKLVSTVPS